MASPASDWFVSVTMSPLASVSGSCLASEVIAVGVLVRVVVARGFLLERYTVQGALLSSTKF